MFTVRIATKKGATKATEKTGKKEKTTTITIITILITMTPIHLHTLSNVITQPPGSNLLSGDTLNTVNTMTESSKIEERALIGSKRANIGVELLFLTILWHFGSFRISNFIKGITILLFFFSRNEIFRFPTIFQFQFQFFQQSKKKKSKKDSKQNKQNKQKWQEKEVVKGKVVVKVKEK